MKRHMAWSGGTVVVTVPAEMVTVKLPKPMIINGVLVNEWAKFEQDLDDGGSTTFHLYGEGLALLAGKEIIAKLFILKEQRDDGSQRILLDLGEPKVVYNFLKPSHRVCVVRKGDSLRGGWRYFDSTGDVLVAVAPALAYKAKIEKLTTAFARA